MHSDLEIDAHADYVPFPCPFKPLCPKFNCASEKVEDLNNTRKCNIIMFLEYFSETLIRLFNIKIDGERRPENSVESV